MIADDLFAGAGGWDLAAAALGIHARGVENMPEARATRDAAGLETIHGDVWTFKPHYLGRDLKATGLIASPPCQTFSQAGKGSGRKALNVVRQLAPHVGDYTLKQLRRIGLRATGDERTALVLTPLWFAIHHPYRWLAWEQVPTVLPVWGVCAEVLREHGWHVWAGKLHAEQYGVPQARTRAFLLASRSGPVSAPEPTHSRYYSRDPGRLDLGVERWVSMAEALGWGMYRRPSPTITGGGTETGGAGPIAKLARYTGRPDWLERGTQPRPWIVAAGITGEGRPRSTDAPAPTVTGKGTAYWLEDASDWRAPRHAPDEPCDCPVTFTATNPRPNAAHRAPCQPAPTMAFGHEEPRWNPRETTPDGLPRFAQQSDNPIDFDWPERRPATVVAGRDLVQAPGATANRFNGSTKSRNDGVRVSVAEAGVLQSFPADFPWQGSKSRRFLQAGNAVPPLLARHALAAAAVHHLAIDEEAAS
jgi:DNA (cytosine-5)-methyltransferase 1